MKKGIAVLDILASVVFGSMICFGVLIVLVATSFSSRRRYRGGAINRFSFAIADFIEYPYPSMVEDALLNGYISRDDYIYLDYRNPGDRSRRIGENIDFQSIAAHPNTRLFRAGFTRLSALMTELKVLARASAMIRQTPVSFIKAHDPHLVGLNGLIVSRLFRLPRILHMNSDFEMKYRGTGRISSGLFVTRSFERLFESWVIGSYDLIMADRKLYLHSRSFPRRCASRYRAFGVRVDRAHYDPVEERTDLKGSFGIKGKKAALFVGRLHPVKYPLDALEAFERIAGELPDACILFVGTGILEDQLKNHARAQGINERVFFLGAKTTEELKNIYYTADVLIAPHGGITLVESALAGTPIVAYDFDWHTEFIENGTMGFIVPFKDVGMLAAKTKELLLNGELAKKMGECCRNVAVSRYSRDESIRNERMIYNEFLAS